jgi:hypothetical protein
MAKRALRRDRVLCLEESVWDESLGLSDRASVLPTLELLQRLGVLDAFSHRHVYGKDEFERYLAKREVDRRVRSFGTVYLAFHGSAEGLDAGGHLYSLDALADHLGPLPGGVVHLGSCFVLKNNEAAGRRFLKRTGASLISGYQRDVEWLDSAALDSAWLGYLADPGRIGDIERRFRKRYASLIDYLQWGAVSASR